MVRTSALIVCATLALAAPCAAAGPPPRAPEGVRDAAMRQLQKPTGVGGCVFLAVPLSVRQAALMQVLAGKPGSPPDLQAAVAQAAPKCTGQPYVRSDTALIMTVTANVRRAGAALYFAQAHGVGQSALDAAWRAASPEQKAPFVAMADEALGPGDSVTPRELEVAPLARAAGLRWPLEPLAEGLLRAYFTSAVIIEKAEADLHARGARPPAA